jgi:hypothetical protein
MRKHEFGKPTLSEEHGKSRFGRTGTALARVGALVVRGICLWSSIQGIGAKRLLTHRRQLLLFQPLGGLAYAAVAVVK